MHTFGMSIEQTKAWHARLLSVPGVTSPKNAAGCGAGNEWRHYLSPSEQPNLTTRVKEKAQTKFLLFPSLSDIS